MQSKVANEKTSGMLELQQINRFEYSTQSNYS